MCLCPWKCEIWNRNFVLARICALLIFWFLPRHIFLSTFFFLRFFLLSSEYIGEKDPKVHTLQLICTQIHSDCMFSPCSKSADILAYFTKCQFHTLTEMVKSSWNSKMFNFYTFLHQLWQVKNLFNRFDRPKSEFKCGVKFTSMFEVNSLIHHLQSINYLRKNTNLHSRFIISQLRMKIEFMKLCCRNSSQQMSDLWLPPYSLARSSA